MLASSSFFSSTKCILLLGLFSSHSISMASDILLGEEHVGLHPVEPVNDTNNQILKPSQASLTQTTEKIVIHVTDHSEVNKGE